MRWRVELNLARRETLFKFLDWDFWDTGVNEAVRDFERIHQVLPDRLVANTRTLEKIDRMAETTAARGGPGFIYQSGCAMDKDAEGIEQGVIMITRFMGSDYFLDFMVNESVPDDWFILALGPKTKAPGVPWN